MSEMKDGKLQQFLDYYDTYYPKVYKYSYYRLGGQVAEAQELVAAVFRRALDQFPSYDPELSFQAWLFRVAHQHLDSFARNKKPVQELTAGVTLEGKEMQLFQLAAAVQKLPAESRAVIELRFFADCSPEDLATILGVSVNQVYVSVNRALASLKKTLS